jgi:hypothetical protein
MMSLTGDSVDVEAVPPGTHQERESEPESAPPATHGTGEELDGAHARYGESKENNMNKCHCGGEYFSLGYCREHFIEFAESQPEGEGKKRLREIIDENLTWHGNSNR